jgi:hypothetical protein
VPCRRHRRTHRRTRRRTLPAAADAVEVRGDCPRRTGPLSAPRAHRRKRHREKMCCVERGGRLTAPAGCSTVL